MYVCKCMCLCMCITCKCICVWMSPCMCALWMCMCKCDLAWEWRMKMKLKLKMRMNWRWRCRCRQRWNSTRYNCQCYCIEGLLSVDHRFWLVGSLFTRQWFQQGELLFQNSVKLLLQWCTWTMNKSMMAEENTACLLESCIVECDYVDLCDLIWSDQIAMIGTCTYRELPSPKPRAKAPENIPKPNRKVYSSPNHWFFLGA